MKGMTMITLDELYKLESGTIIYVAAPGILPEKHRPNTLSEEKFISMRQTARDPHLMTTSGGYSFSYVRKGQALFLDKSEAEDYMQKRHEEIYVTMITDLSKEISNLQDKLKELCEKGAGKANYIYHERAENYIPDIDMEV